MPKYFKTGRFLVKVGSVVLLTLVVASQVSRAAGESALVSAVKTGDVRQVRAALDKRPDVNAREADGSTALLFAIHQTNREITELLLQAGADANAANRYGVTPLLQSARVGSTAITKALLEAKANPGVAAPDGTTPLMLAAAAGDVEGVRLLALRGADVNAKEQAEEQTALMWAADGGHAAVIEALIEAGANPNVSARTWQMPRGRVRPGQPAQAPPNFSAGGLTPLMFAARRGHVDAIHKLAAGGADVKFKTGDGFSAMVLAVVNDQLDAAQALLDRGADPNDGSMYEAVVLHNLRTNDTVGEATRPRPLNQLENRTTPIEFVTRLLDRGGNPRLAASHILHFRGQGNNGSVVASQSAFERAVQAQDVAMLQLMLVRGADPSAPIGTSTPLQLALAGGGGARGAGIGFTPAAFRYRTVRSSSDAVTALLDAGADPNGTNEAGDTALHAAARAGNVALIELLLAKGATIDIQDKAGLTPLDFAMGKAAPAPPGGDGPPRGGGAGGRGGGGGAPAPQPQAIVLLRARMGLPPLSEAEMPRPARGAGPGRGGQQ